MQVESTFTESRSAPLELRMSRSSPGRYALHDFAKNVYDVQACGADGRALRVDAAGSARVDRRPATAAPSRFATRSSATRLDGTYLAIDPTHAHINMPAAVMWAGARRSAGLADFEPPAGAQLAGRDAAASRRDAARVHRAEPAVPDGQPGRIRSGRDARVHRRTASRSASRCITRRHARRGRRLRPRRREDRPRAARRSSASSRGTSPATTRSSPTTCPTPSGDGMEHRNSTVMTSRLDRCEPGALRCSARVAHEFFHGWNVERIRPRSLEPFDFERANMSGELWLAEGFTQYYGPLAHGARRDSPISTRPSTDIRRARRERGARIRRAWFDRRKR